MIELDTVNVIFISIYAFYGLKLGDIVVRMCRYGDSFKDEYGVLTDGYVGFLVFTFFLSIASIGALTYVCSR